MIRPEHKTTHLLLGNDSSVLILQDFTDTLVMSSNVMPAENIEDDQCHWLAVVDRAAFSTKKTKKKTRKRMKSLLSR